MFTEELAREIGVAYGLYCAICKTDGKDAMKADDFKKLCCDSIERIRDVGGLVPENPVTG